MVSITLQEFADDVVAPEYKQPLKTVEDACKANGWPVADSPVCCGKPVEIRSLIGPYYAECTVCGLFIRDVSGPNFSGTGSVWFIDHDKVDTDTEARWIAGRLPAGSVG